MSAEEKPTKKIRTNMKEFTLAGNIQNKLCKYIHRYCFQERIHGYDFCIRHILEDKNAPFRQCTYVQQPHKRKCTNAAPKTDKNDKREALCPFHAKQSLLKIKPSFYRRKPPKGPKALLRALEHYCRHPRHDPEYTKEVGLAERYETAPCETHCPASLKPSSEFDLSEKSSSDKVSGYIDTFEDHRDWELGSKDLLRHAGVYTGKEIISIARDKAIRLKALYIEELKRTYYRLKEFRREYLQEVKNESKKNPGKSISASKSKMLRYLESYHSPLGIDKVMRRKSEQKRMGITSQQPACTFIQNGQKCTETAIVCTPFCLKHILSDPKQCLFVPCSVTSKKKCDVPVLPVGGDFNVCKLHLYTTLLPESKEGQSASSTEAAAEQEHFQSMDDIASLGLDVITPGSLFGLDQEADVNTFFRNPSWGIKFESNFGEPSESTDTVMSEEQTDLLEIQPITLNPPADILSDGRKSDIEEEK